MPSMSQPVSLVVIIRIAVVDYVIRCFIVLSLSLMSLRTQCPFGVLLCRLHRCFVVRSL